jgi:DNA-binding IscR family transcriptional regulator
VLFRSLEGQPQGGCCLLSVGGCNNQATCGVHSVIHGAERQFFDFLAAESARSLGEKMFALRGPLGAPIWRERTAGTPS